MGIIIHRNFFNIEYLDIKTLNCNSIEVIQ